MHAPTDLRARPPAAVGPQAPGGPFPCGPAHAQDAGQETFEETERTLVLHPRFAQRSPDALTHPARMVRMVKGRVIVQSALSEVRYFEAQGKYTRVVLRDQDGLLRSGLSSLLNQLPADGFLRIHRSLVANLLLIERIQRDDMGRLALYMAGRSEKLVVAQPYEHLFREGIF